jgi:hypothetical protein
MWLPWPFRRPRRPTPQARKRDADEAIGEARRVIAAVKRRTADEDPFLVRAAFPPRSDRR